MLSDCNYQLIFIGKLVSGEIIIVNIKKTKHKREMKIYDYKVYKRNPEGFGMPMVMTFLQQIRQQKLFSEMGWRFFPEYLLALRFAWLSEWLRQKDKEMIEMEEAYMELLVDNMDILRQGWEL